MNISTNLLILIVCFAAGMFLGEYLGIPCMYLHFGLLLFFVLYCINFYYSHRTATKEVKMRQLDLEKYWEIVEKNPSLVKDGAKMGFK